jgi:cytochrome c oxidase subunit 2
MPGGVRKKLLFAALGIVTVLATAGAALAANGGFTPESPHSPNAHRINQAYYLISGFTLAIFFIVEIALVVFIVKYRRRGRPRTAEGSQLHGHTRLEIIWTVIPVVIIATIFGFVFYKLPGISGPPSAVAANEQLTIHVDAHQFYWQFTYPNGAVSIDEVHLPLDKVVKLTINSEDVNHSWWIPQLGGKTDAIPGRTNTIWYKPEKTGTYVGQCAEFCGIYHERMLARALVESESDYQRFVTGEAAKQLGKAEWQGVCAKCHGMQGEGDYGPALASNPTLIQPSGLETIVRNGRGRMPGVGSNWTQKQMRALERYLKSNVYKGASSSGG